MKHEEIFYICVVYSTYTTVISAWIDKKRACVAWIEKSARVAWIEKSARVAWIEKNVFVISGKMRQIVK